MSAKIKAIARIVWHDGFLYDWDKMTADEIAEREEVTAGLIDGNDFGELGHYVGIACAASDGWDAAIAFAPKGDRE